MKNPCSVRLTCGHTVTLKRAPLRGNQKFACNMNLGCGYSLEWTESKEAGGEWQPNSHPAQERNVR